MSEPGTNRSTFRGRAPHRRDENARVAVLHAADDLLVERGFARVTIEGIAARAGVAKQTIYRWWPSKVEILLDTLTEDAGRLLVVPEEGSAVEAIRRYVCSLAGLLTEPAGQVLLALMGEAQHDPEVARLFHDRYLEPQRRMEREMLARGVISGEFRSGLDLDAVLDAVFGPVFFRAFIRTPIDQWFVDGLLVDNLLPHLTHTAQRTRAL